MKFALMIATALATTGAVFAQDMKDQDATEADDDIVHAVQEAYDNADLDRAPYTDDHALIEANVYGSQGGELGEVERVRLSADGEVEAIVVEYGGLLEVGGREILIEAGDFAASETDGRMIVTLEMDREAFLAMPDFNEDAASEYPLSDDDYNDDQAEEELNPSD